MRRRLSRARVWSPTSVALGLAALGAWAPGAASAAPSIGEPLSASNYAVRQACSAPAPGEAGCLALQLIPLTSAARARTHPVALVRRRAIRAASAAEGAFGLRPVDLHDAYNLPEEATGSETIGIVDAYNDPTAEGDLKVYDEEFGLPACTHANGCFRKVNEDGGTTVPPNNGEWAVEISLDIEIAHAVCQGCHVLLVEAASAGYQDLETAEERAVSMGANVISNSWGGGEPPTDSGAFDHPGVVIAAAAGDNGYLNWDAEEAEARGSADYPATSPHVVAVGGTRLALKAGAWKEESVWNDGAPSGGHGAGGGGCSEGFSAQPWQRSVSDWLEVGCGTKRAVADVAADADPYSGVAIYDSTPEVTGHTAPKWTTVGGTSLASPIIASTFALAGGANGVAYPARTLYEHLGSASFHDITSGSNGECTKPFNGNTGHAGCTTAEEAANCSSKLICLAATGYDGPTGVGTPDALSGFIPPAPSVTGVSPSEGSTDGGDSVTITGSNLEGATAVDFGSTPASEFKIKSDSEVIARSPAAGAAETVDVTVTDAGGTSAITPADSFNYVVPPPPTVTGVSPNEGTTNGGHTVTITGTDLEGASAVDFGTTPASQIEVRSATELTVKSPASSSPGEVDVTVITPGGASETGVADRFTYVLPLPPAVTSIAPADGSAAGGTQVTISGENLEAASAVQFDGASAKILADEETSITVEAPAHAAETVGVKVLTAGGESAASPAATFTYIALPKGHSATGPGAGEATTSSGAGASDTQVPPPGATSTTSPGSLRLLARPTVNTRTGAVTFKLSVPQAGTLTWLLSFRNGSFGVFAARSKRARCASSRIASGKRCWPAKVVFGEGQEAFEAPGTVSVTVVPSGPARQELASLLKRGRALAVAALFAYHVEGGASTQAPASFRVKLRRTRAASRPRATRASVSGLGGVTFGAQPLAAPSLIA